MHNSRNFRNKRKIVTPTRIPHPLLVCALAIFMGKPVLANNEDEIARCARIPTVGDRIICLEDALRNASNLAPITDNVAKTPVPEPAEASPADIFESPEPVQDSVVVAESVVVAVASTTTKPVPAVSPPEATVADRPAPQTELGAEQVASSENKNPDENRIFASVVAFDVVGSGKLRFKLDNGQIWRQTGDDDRNIRRKLRNAENIPVEMWQSRTGGYRMRFLTIDRVVRVKRLK